MEEFRVLERERGTNKDGMGLDGGQVLLKLTIGVWMVLELGI